MYTMYIIHMYNVVVRQAVPVLKCIMPPYTYIMYTMYIIHIYNVVVRQAVPVLKCVMPSYNVHNTYYI